MEISNLLCLPGEITEASACFHCPVPEPAFLPGPWQAKRPLIGAQAHEPTVRIWNMQFLSSSTGHWRIRTAPGVRHLVRFVYPKSQRQTRFVDRASGAWEGSHGILRGPLSSVGYIQAGYCMSTGRVLAK